MLKLAEVVSPDLADRLVVSAAHRHADTAQLERWIARRRRDNPFAVTRVPLDGLEGWSFASRSGDLVHESGRFFSVQGIHVRTDYGPVAEWSQPILDQPERSILGILVREIDGVLHFLMQAKMEPGNENTVQISPTVQATRSNYTRAHHGRRAPYVEYFAEPGRARVLVDVLQSEQGSWFRGKRNRNVVMEITGDVERHDDYIWLTLGELYALLLLPNVVNMDSRTVLSCLPLTGPRNDDPAISSTLEVGSWLTRRKARYELTTTQAPLCSLAGWERSDAEIRHWEGKYFSIVGVRVRATNREVGEWCQPLLAPCSDGLVAFVARRIDGVLHLLARADLRPGYRDVVELGPTVQCTPGNLVGHPERRPPFLDLVLSRDVNVRFDVRLSEEGGRFDHAVTRHMIVEVGEDFPLATSPDYAWVTPAQLQDLIRSSYQVNIEARSLFACLNAIGR
jgi:oxidase EvaA